MTSPKLFDVAVDGGRVRAARWGATDAPTAVAAHGITSSHVFWSMIGQMLADRGLALLAPDLRGRGDSSEPSGTSSMAAHAQDLLTVCAHLGVEPSVVVGHSMGGFVAAVCGVRHPDFIQRVVLVDGGPPIGDQLPPDSDVEAVLLQVIGPSLERLEQRFATPQDYRDFWHAHPACAGIPDDLIDAYADHDLRPDGDVWRSKVSRRAVLEDARALLQESEVREAVANLRCPTTFIHAERGMLDGPDGLYPASQVDSLVGDLAHVRTLFALDTNHFTIGMSPHGAAIVTDAIADSMA
ncbi:MAG: alpha/beta hydrolase [Euzebya sp.]